MGMLTGKVVFVTGINLRTDSGNGAVLKRGAPSSPGPTECSRSL
jgi:hypothetical protein